ncbi:MAG: histidine kinase [Hymenobacter sp.]
MLPPPRRPALRRRRPRPARPGLPPWSAPQGADLWRVLGWIALACAGTTAAVWAAALARPEELRRFGGDCLQLRGGAVVANGYTADLLNLRTGWSERPMRRLLFTVGTSFVASLLVIVLVGEGYAVLLFHRPPGYTAAAHQFSGSRSIVPLLATVVDLAVYALASIFAGLARGRRAGRAAGKETAVARLDSLRRQVDPHFLFNSLNALTAPGGGKRPGPRRALHPPAQQVYRYVLDSQSQELVPLADEAALRRSLPVSAKNPPGRRPGTWSLALPPRRR